MTALAPALTQRQAALERANEIRIKRSALKADVRSGETTVAAVLTAVPAYAATMPISALLRAQHGWERIRVRKALARVNVAENNPLADITPRQRKAIIAVTRGEPVPRRPRPSRPVRVVLSPRGPKYHLHLVPNGSRMTACGIAVMSRWRDATAPEWSDPARNRCSNCMRAPGLVVGA